MTELGELMDSIEGVAAVFGSDAAGEVGSGFNCGEADAVARLLAVTGHVQDAATWVAGHAEGDDQGDRHWAIGAAGRLAAEAYVEGLAGQAAPVSVLKRQAEGLDADAERNARERFSRITSVLDGLAAGLFTEDRVNAVLDGVLTLWEAEDVLDSLSEE